MDKNISARFYTLVSAIPAGKVTTYGALAKQAGIHPRQAGLLLHRNPDPKTIPCHRVVNSQGKLAEHFAFGGLIGQQARLIGENVAVENGKVDLSQYGI